MDPVTRMATRGTLSGLSVGQGDDAAVTGDDAVLLLDGHDHQHGPALPIAVDDGQRAGEPPVLAMCLTTSRLAEVPRPAVLK